MLTNIIISGVGGQGTLLASKILSCAAGKKSLFVRTSETIGMAQRGGSVSSHLRIDAREVSPIIPNGAGDIMLAFEPAEGARMLPKMKRGAHAVVSTSTIIPTNVSLGKGVYLYDEYIAAIKSKLPEAVFIDGAALALEAGDIRTLNIVILGAAAEMLPFTKEELTEAIKECVKPKLLEMNMKAFRLGFCEACRAEAAK